MPEKQWYRNGNGVDIGRHGDDRTAYRQTIYLNDIADARLIAAAPLMQARITELEAERDRLRKAADAVVYQRYGHAPEQVGQAMQELQAALENPDA